MPTAPRTTPRRLIERLATAPLAALIAAAIFAGPARADTPTATAFKVGAGVRPSKITAGGDDNLWFTSYQQGAIGRVTTSGQITMFTAGITGAPRSITAGPDSNVWFTEPGFGEIGFITPTGLVTEYQDNTVDPNEIVAGPDGNLWLTDETHDAIVRATTAGAFTSFPLGAGTDPRGIAVGADGNLWFAEATAHKIGRISTTGADLQEFPVPGGHSPSAITAGPDGALWFTAGEGLAGRITTAGVASLIEIPHGSAAIAAGPDGNIWVTQWNDSSLVRITPGGTVTPVGVDTGADPSGIAAGPDGSMWVASAGVDPTTPTRRVSRVTTGVPAPQFTDPVAIYAPSQSSSAADPYPSTIQVSGLHGTVTGVSVRLNGLFHRSGSDLAAALVGPQGQTSLLLENETDKITDLTTPPDVLDGEVVTFKAGAPTAPQRLTSGIFSPVSPGFLLSFPAPAPVASPAANLNVFNGSDPNGAWRLFVYDDDNTPGSTGRIAGGWSLDIQTTGNPAPQIPGPATTLTEAGPVITRPAPTDTTPPVLTLGKLPTTLTLAALRKGVGVQLTPSEPVTIDATLAAGVSRATLSSTRRVAAAGGFPLELATASAAIPSAGLTSFLLKPAAGLLPKRAKAFSVQLRIDATDRAGNHASVTRRIAITTKAKAKAARRLR